MTLKGIKAGDIVEVDVRGHEFFAIVDQTPEDHGTILKKGELMTRPISNGRGQVCLVTSRQVKARFKKCKS